VFTVAYLAFGVPVVIAGQLIPRVGLSSTAIGYCVATGVAATIGLIAESAVARRRTSRDAAVTRRGEGEILVPVVPDPRLGETPPRQALDGRRLVHDAAVEDDRQGGDARAGTA
jgi:hypothetical protein